MDEVLLAPGHVMDEADRLCPEHLGLEKEVGRSKLGPDDLFGRRLQLADFILGQRLPAVREVSRYVR